MKNLYLNRYGLNKMMITRNNKKRKANRPETIEEEPQIVLKVDKVIQTDDDEPETEVEDTEEEDIEESSEDEDDADYEQDSDLENLDYEDQQIIETLKKKNPKIYQNFSKAKNIIKSREVPIMEILSADITDEKRANLIEQYECLKQIPPCTDEYLSTRDGLRTTYYRYLESCRPSSATKPPSIKIPLPKKIDESESSTFQKKLTNLVCSDHNRKVLEEKLEEFDDSARGEEKSKCKKWLSLALNLPFDRLTDHNYEIRDKIQEINDFLNKKLYGMKNVKERLTLFLNKKLRQKDSKGCSIALLGQAGVGKTSVAKALSQCLGLPFAQVSFGGVNSSDFLLGHDYTFLGSRPGEISRCLTRMGSKNGILFFDEFDKVSDKKDILSSLLHITDFSQNYEFRDSYFPELTQDLSKCWFIYSMNHLPDDPALVDRLEVIKVDGYSIEDRKVMTRDYLIPKFIEEFKISEEITFTDSAIDKIVLLSGDGQRGVRDLERYISLIVEKTYFFVCNQKGNYDFKWYKKMSGEAFVGGKVIISDDLVDLIFKENKPDPVYYSMYM